MILGSCYVWTSPGQFWLHSKGKIVDESKLKWFCIANFKQKVARQGSAKTPQRSFLASDLAKRMYFCPIPSLKKEVGCSSGLSLGLDERLLLRAITKIVGLIKYICLILLIGIFPQAISNLGKPFILKYFISWHLWQWTSSLGISERVLMMPCKTLLEPGIQIYKLGLKASCKILNLLLP